MGSLKFKEFKGPNIPNKTPHYSLSTKSNKYGTGRSRVKYLEAWINNLNTKENNLISTIQNIKHYIRKKIKYKTTPKTPWDAKTSKIYDKKVVEKKYLRMTLEDDFSLIWHCIHYG